MGPRGGCLARCGAPTCRPRPACARHAIWTDHMVAANDDEGRSAAVQHGADPRRPAAIPLHQDRLVVVRIGAAHSQHGSQIRALVAGRPRRGLAFRGGRACFDIVHRSQQRPHLGRAREAGEVVHHRRGVGELAADRRSIRLGDCGQNGPRGVLRFEAGVGVEAILHDHRRQPWSKSFQRGVGQPDLGRGCGDPCAVGRRQPG